MSEQKKLSRGVFLPCFGKRGYYFAAYNFAFSIKKHNPDIQIAIFHDDQIEKELCYGFMPGIFDIRIKIPDEILWHGGKIDPAYIKIMAPAFHPFDLTLQMDVECQALHNINDIFDELEADGGYFYSHIIGEHRLSEGREIGHMVWAYADDIWNHFNLPQDAVLPSTNSSFQFWRKSTEAIELNRQIRANYEFPMPIDRLRYAWGGTQPDELYLNVALAQKKIIGRTPRKYLFMGNESTDVMQAQVEKEFPILCFFGTTRQSKPFFINWYDENLIRWHAEKGLPHFLKYHLIQADKHANQNNIIRTKAPEYKDDIITEQKHEERAYLYQPFFFPEEKSRAEELIRTLKMNVACEEIEKIFLLTEYKTDALSGALFGNKKIQFIHLNSRTTYQDCINEANKHADDKIISIIANADIYFDNRNIRLIKELSFKDTAYALSRWDIDSTGAAKHFNYEWSQDSWIFKGNIPSMKSDFIFGVPACDNRFAFEMKKVFRRLANPSFTIKSYHLHLSGVHHYTESNRLPGSVLSLHAETALPYRKKKLLMIQHGKVGDILICLPMARKLSEEYLIDWLCPKEYHSLFEYVRYARAVDQKKQEYDRVLDLSFGQGGGPEGWWQANKQRFDSFVEAKYELAGIQVEERGNLKYDRNEKKEDELLNLIHKKAGGRPFALIHSSSDYGDPAKYYVADHLSVIEFKPIEGFSIFDWRKIILHAEEIHAIDSSLCNFIDVIPEARDIKKFYYKTTKVPNKWDETILSNNWNRVESGILKKEEADAIS